MREGRKQFRFRVGDPKPLKSVIHFPEDLQLVRRFFPQIWYMRAMPKATSLVTTMARRAPAPKGFSLTNLFVTWSQ